MLGKMVSCACCGVEVEWEKAKKTCKRSGTRVRYFCEECGKKEILVYQPYYKESVRNIGLEKKTR